MARKIAVIGGGLVGLATAYKLLLRQPGLAVVVLEKEAEAGQHQSTHNSGVLHAGLYYRPGSRKAELAVKGIRQMTQFCRDQGIRHEICGKLVVATDARELPALNQLWERGIANGLKGLRRLDPVGMREVEPHVAGVAAIHVPEEGIVDYQAVVDALVKLVCAHGGVVRFGFRVVAISRVNGSIRITGDANGLVEEVDFVVSCAGLQSDRVARMGGVDPAAKIVPFRGEYFVLREDRRHLVRNLIYPVPDPEFPFLGVHFTRMVQGGIEAGPNAVLAMKREGYRWSDLDVGDLAETLGFPGLWRFLRRYPHMAFYEVYRSLSRAEFCRSLQRLVPEIRADDLQPGGSGVRAQAMRRDGSLVEDFHFVESDHMLHVVNAPSPAATASLAIADEIVARIPMAA